MVTCQDMDRLLAPYLDGEAVEDERRRIDEHLSACLPCSRRARAESTGGTRAAVSMLERSKGTQHQCIGHRVQRAAEEDDDDYDDGFRADNRETIDGCREQAEKAKKAVRCTIEVKSANDGR